jgi:hypothetical protein
MLYGDYAMTVISKIRSSAQMKPTKWNSLEDKVLGEFEDFEDDVLTGTANPVPLHERQYYKELDDICQNCGKDTFIVVSLIRFYKKRYGLVHSGLKNMTQQEKINKIESNILGVESLPSHLAEYKSVLREAISLYADSNISG